MRFSTPSRLSPIFSLFLLLPLTPITQAQLNSLAKAKGLTYFGSAIDNNELTDTPYMSVLSDTTEFGQVTPANALKWQAIEPSQNSFDYSAGDAVVNMAQANGQLLRCHNLCWNQALPDWVSSGSWTNETLIAVLKNHITNEVTHYKGKCYAWDVVNEALNEDGTYRSDIFYDTIGPEYIPIAFEAAAAADPSAKLYYNEYNLETPGPKANGAINLVKSLQARGIKIDGIGLQAHFIVGQSPSLATLTASLNSFTALGVDVAITELDIRHPSLPPSSSAVTQQATDFFNTVSACLAANGAAAAAAGSGKCVGVGFWDFTDKYSWIKSFFNGQGDACAWDENMAKKPTVYAAIVSALTAGSAATTVSTSSVATTLSTVSTAASGTVVSYANSTTATTTDAGTTATGATAGTSASSGTSTAIATGTEATAGAGVSAAPDSSTTIETSAAPTTDSAMVTSAPSHHHHHSTGRTRRVKTMTTMLTVVIDIDVVDGECGEL